MLRDLFRFNFRKRDRMINGNRFGERKIIKSFSIRSSYVQQPTVYMP